MSKERCQSVKDSLKQVIDTLNSGTCGSVEMGFPLAYTMEYVVNAYLRLDQHMRMNGWTADAVYRSPPPANPMDFNPNGTVNAALAESITAAFPRVSNLAPAAQIPKLSTGLMNGGMKRNASEVSEDLGLL